MNINEIFENMDYGATAANLEDEAKGWIGSIADGTLGPFIGGCWKLDGCNDRQEVSDFSSDDNNNKLCFIAYQQPLHIDDHHLIIIDDDRTASLLRLADILSKKKNVVAGLEALSTGRCIGPIVNFVLPQAIKWLKQWASQSTTTKQQQINNKNGPVVISVPCGTSVATVVRQLGPCLMGSKRALLLRLYNEKKQNKNRPRINLGLFYLAEMVKEANFPLGALNVVYDGDSWSKFGRLEFDEIHLETEQEQIANVIGSGFTCFSMPKWRIVFVVCDSADLNGAVEEAARAIAHSTQEKTCLRIYVQESVYDTFLGILRLCLAKLRCGKCTDVNVDIPQEYSSLVESLLTPERPEQWIETELVQLEAFRTVKEVVSLVNNINKGSSHNLRFSLWTELLSVALEVSDELKANCVWINCYGEELQTSDTWIEVAAPTQSLCIKLLEDLKPPESTLKAVEAAVKALTIGSWKKLSQMSRADKLRQSLEKKENWAELSELLGSHDQLIQVTDVLRTDSARYADAYAPRLLSEESFGGKITSELDAKGVVAVVDADGSSLTHLLRMAILPALIAGNSLLIFSKQTKIISNFIQMLGLPSGTMTLVSDDDWQAELTLNQLRHTHVRAVFYFGTKDARDVSISLSSPTLRHLQIVEGNATNDQMLQLLPPVSEMSVGDRKTVWLPSGVTFAT